MLTPVVGTAFGETIEADGPSGRVKPRGHVYVGDDVLPWGRYGETAATGLQEALEALGVTFSEQSIEIGPRFRRGHIGWAFATLSTLSLYAGQIRGSLG